jgi:hypothetical protein
MRGDIRTHEIDPTDDLVAGHDRVANIGQLGIDEMKIGPAYAACADLHPELTLAGYRVRPLLHLEPRSRGRQHHRAHQSLRGERFD